MKEIAYICRAFRHILTHLSNFELIRLVICAGMGMFCKPHKRKMQNLTLKSKQVFNYLFDMSRQEGIELTPMKSIKLVYFCHAWYLGFDGKPLLNEPVEAWKYGAVIPSLYHSLKIYGAGDIKYPIMEKQDKLYLDIYIENDSLLYGEKPVSYDSLVESERVMIDAVWRNYKNLTAAKLSGMMHQPGTPWSQTWEADSRGHAIITNERIMAFYKSKVDAAQ